MSCVTPVKHDIRNYHICFEQMKQIHQCKIQTKSVFACISTQIKKNLSINWTEFLFCYKCIVNFRVCETVRYFKRVSQFFIMFAKSAKKTSVRAENLNWISSAGRVLFDRPTNKFWEQQRLHFKFNSIPGTFQLRFFRSLCSFVYALDVCCYDVCIKNN